MIRRNALCHEILAEQLRSQRITKEDRIKRVNIRIIGIGPLFRIHKKNVDVSPRNRAIHWDFQVNLYVRQRKGLAKIRKNRRRKGSPRGESRKKTLNHNNVIAKTVGIALLIQNSRSKRHMYSTLLRATMFRLLTCHYESRPINMKNWHMCLFFMFIGLRGRLCDLSLGS